MGVLDFILNLAGLLLWLNSRPVRFDTVGTPSLTLLRTLRRAGPASDRRWRHWIALALLLIVRAVIYRQLGAAVHWTPHLHLDVIALPFRSDALEQMLWFSLLSFGLVLAMFYLWLLVLSVVNRSLPDTDPLQKLVRLHLGRAEGLPAVVKLLLPPLLAVLIWLAFGPLLTALGILPAARSLTHTLQQALVMALASTLACKFLFIGVLLLHLLASYVYLGGWPLWSYATATAGRLLAPIRWLPLRFGRVDLMPVAGIVFFWSVAEFGVRWLGEFYLRLPL